MADKYCYWCGEAYSAVNCHNFSSNIGRYACSFCALDPEIDNICRKDAGNCKALELVNDLKPITTGCQYLGKYMPRNYVANQGMTADFSRSSCPSITAIQSVLFNNKSTKQLPANWNGMVPFPNAFTSAAISNPPPIVSAAPPIPNGNGLYCVGCNNELTNNLKLICGSCYNDPKIYPIYKKIKAAKVLNPSNSTWIGPIGFDKSTYGSNGPPWVTSNVIKGITNHINSQAKVTPKVTPPLAPAKYNADDALRDYLVLTGLLPRRTGPIPDNKIRPLCTDCGMPISQTLDAYYGKDPEQAAKCKGCRD